MNLNGICVPGKNSDDPLLKVSTSLSALAGGTTDLVKFVLPKGRGDVKALEIIVGSETVADLAELTGTLMVNGIEILTDDAMMSYSPLMQNDRKIMLINLPESTNITGSVTNGSGTAITVFYVFYFYNPYETN